MPLKSFDTQDAVPEELRDAAIETKDGKFVVAVDEDVTPLKSTIEAARKEAKEAKRKAKAAEDALAELQAEKEAEKAGLTGDKLAEIRAQAEAKFKPQLDRLAQIEAENRSLKLDSAVKGFLAKADVIDVEDTWQLVSAKFDLTEDGKPILKDDPTADIEKYIKSDLKAQKPYLFKGTQASGGGAAGTQKGRTPNGSAKPVTQWDADERAAYEEANGVGSVARLRDEYLRESLKPKDKAAA